MNFPQAVPVKMLMPTHPDYDPALLTEIGDFYAGGARMDARKHLYLKPRSSDSNAGYQRSRLLSTIYNNYLGPQLDAIAAEIVGDEPCFDVSDASDDRAAFWTALNTDCDGRGNDCTVVIQNIILDLLKFRRAYLLVEMPALDGFPGETLAAAKGRGRLDGNFVNIPGETVDRWQETNGRLDWIRAHTIDLEYPSPVSALCLERHTWTYYCADSIYSYTAMRPQPTSVFLSAEWPKDAVASLVVKPNIFGVCPVVACTANFSLADRLLPTARGLFNLESARAFTLETSALGLPILLTEKTDIAQLMLNELSVLTPGIGGDFKFATPSGDLFTALKVACDDLRGNFDKIVSNLAQHSASLIQNPVQSAKAKALDQAPKEILLSLFSMPASDGIERAINMLAAARGEQQLDPRLCGLNDPDSENVGQALGECAEFLALPVPAIARTAAIRKLCNAYLPRMTETERKTLERQLTATATVTTNGGVPNVPVSNGSIPAAASTLSGNDGGSVR